MVETEPLDQKILPKSKWLTHIYGIQWSGKTQILGGQLAKVFLIREERTNQLH